MMAVMSGIGLTSSARTLAKSSGIKRQKGHKELWRLLWNLVDIVQMCGTNTSMVAVVALLKSRSPTFCVKALHTSELKEEHCRSKVLSKLIQTP